VYEQDFRLAEKNIAHVVGRLDFRTDKRNSGEGSGCVVAGEKEEGGLSGNGGKTGGELRIKVVDLLREWGGEKNTSRPTASAEQMGGWKKRKREGLTASRGGS